ncbi:hypothetical protein C7H19_06215 [Aphanothece hegewaldii CCALA 016]|uniref:Glycosyltransferase 2-like domain-containing protein n=1 Tax=Aphanothece hegewaldii CCALA 016 TaxID=2107694 RepID=A0A2T1M055_9CHRO|nr:glycosyltransferase family 2 protein [Aphanothece hegewaldii]PSF38063.1 hypothetical protein C7H19_06215 [Aphanothece hegewaldii CCALA 016]
MSSSSSPSVTVVMSVYNGEAYVAEAICSILEQTYQDFEFIIINDGSTDSTQMLICQYAERDSRIRVIHHSQNMMLVYSLNHGLALARGKYIARQDADDISLPKRLEQQVNYLEQNPEVVAVSGRFHRLVSNRLHHGENIIVHMGNPMLMPWHMAFAYSAQHSLSMYRAGVVAPYRKDRLHSEDYDMWYRLMKIGHIVNLPQVIAHVRLHENNITRIKRNEVEATMRICQRDIVNWIADHILSESESFDLQAFGNRHFAAIKNPEVLQTILLKIQQTFANQYPHWRFYSHRFIVRHNLHWLIIALVKGDFKQIQRLFFIIFYWGPWPILLSVLDLLYLQVLPRLWFMIKNFMIRKENCSRSTESVLHLFQ